MDDVRAVMDAAGSARAALFGFWEGGPMSGLFAATYPERTTALIMHGSFPRRTRRADYPWGPTDEEWAALVDQAEREWGGPVWFEARAPSRAQDRVLREWWARALRLGARPAANRRLLQMNTEIDVRHVLRNPRADAHPPQRGRPGASRGGEPMDGGADSWGEVRGAPGTGSRAVALRCRPDPRRDRGVSHGGPPWARARPGPGDRLVR
jgi:pimeloyl-ACP methyl ester carboxylesterase